MSQVPTAMPGQRVVDGPHRFASEQRWNVVLPDGRNAAIGQLLPEAARDIALRRRYVYEAKRIAAIDAGCVPPTLAIGPLPDPLDPEAEAPWRLRLRPVGTTLAEWLDKRAPAPVDEVLELVARLADAVHEVHERGAVLRDLVPESVIMDEHQTVWLADFGLARINILSSHTASSVILERSACAAPEHLRQTTVDLRADIFTLGVILWQGLTGTLSFAQDGALFGSREGLPALADICPGAPPGLEAIVNSALAESVQDRPGSARAFAAMLRGEGHAPQTSLMRLQCQACGASMRPGLRLCLSCGKQAVQFAGIPPELRDDASVANYSVVLARAKEDEQFDRKLRAHLEVVGESVPESLNFIIGDARMYSKEERSKRVSLPAQLFRDLDKDTAEALAKRFTDDGFKVKIGDTHLTHKLRKRGRWYFKVGVGLAVTGVALGAAVSPWFLIVAALGGVSGLLEVGVRVHLRWWKRPTPLARLRSAPAALPASDPFVARLGALLSEVRDPTLREHLGELALWVQRLCDHRAGLASEVAAENTVAMLTEPLGPLVDLIESQVRALIRIHVELSTLDEAVIMRATAASEARGEPESLRASLLDGLDRLRTFEEQRAAGMQRLLEAGSLLEQTVRLGLEVGSSKRLTDNYTQMAMAALRDGD